MEALLRFENQREDHKSDRLDATLVNGLDGFSFWKVLRHDRSGRRNDETTSLPSAFESTINSLRRSLYACQSKSGSLKPSCLYRR